MLDLGHMLISDLAVTDLFIYSLPGMILLYLAAPLYTFAPFLHQRCFCMRYYHFCKDENSIANTNSEFSNEIINLEYHDF